MLIHVTHAWHSSSDLRYLLLLLIRSTVKIHRTIQWQLQRIRGLGLKHAYSLPLPFWMDTCEWLSTFSSAWQFSDYKNKIKMINMFLICFFQNQKSSSEYEFHNLWSLRFKHVYFLPLPFWMDTCEWLSPFSSAWLFSGYKNTINIINIFLICFFLNQEPCSAIWVSQLVIFGV